MSVRGLISTLIVLAIGTLAATAGEWCMHVTARSTSVGAFLPSHPKEAPDPRGVPQTFSIRFRSAFNGHAWLADTSKLNTFQRWAALTTAFTKLPLTDTSSVVCTYSVTAPIQATMSATDSTTYCYHQNVEEEFVPVEREPSFDPAELQRNTVYPPQARAAGVTGVVLVATFVSKTGVVREAKVLESASPLLNDAAVAAVKNTRFKPGRAGQQDVDVWVRIPVVFTPR